MSLGVVFAGECLQHVHIPESAFANVECLRVGFPRFQLVLGKVPFKISKNLTVAVHMNSYISHRSGRICRHPSRHGNVAFSLPLRRSIAKRSWFSPESLQQTQSSVWIKATPPKCVSLSWCAHTRNSRRIKSHRSGRYQSGSINLETFSSSNCWSATLWSCILREIFRSSTKVHCILPTAIPLCRKHVRVAKVKGHEIKLICSSISLLSTGAYRYFWKEILMSETEIWNVISSANPLVVKKEARFSIVFERSSGKSIWNSSCRNSIIPDPTGSSNSWAWAPK